MSLINEIKKIAIAAILDPNDEAQTRKLHRWFSRQFSTPLSDVENLPIEYILLHYLEETYSRMDEEDLLEEAKFAIESPEQRKSREDKESKLDEEFDKEIREEMEQQKKGENHTLKELLKKKRIKKGKEAPPPESIKSEPEEVTPPPDINLQFEDNDLMETWGNTDFIPSKK